MNARTKDKISDINKYVDELESIIPPSLEKYQNILTKAACERYAEKIVEAIIDLATLVLKEKRIPIEESKTFVALEESGIINKDLREQLQKAKGMRNVIAHQYGNIDDKIVFNGINRLSKDAKEFTEKIQEKMK